MKIAVLSSHTPSLFWFRTDMMSAFQTLGHEVIAIGNEPESEWAEKFREKNIRYVHADVKRNGMNPLGELKTLRSLKAVLRREMPDKLFTYQAKTVIYGGVAARQLGIREVYPLIAGLGSVFLGDSPVMKAARLVLKAEYRIALGMAKRVFFQNPDDADFFVRHRLVSREKIVMIHGSGVNLEKFQRQPLPEKTAFLCISRLIRDKGVGEYLQAAELVRERHPDVRFLLVGPYDTNPSAIHPEELQRYLDNGSVEYYGETTDVRPYLAQCSVFVLPSYREGTPKTVLEAMASGRAVITTDVPGCRETVRDGVNGYLVPEKDAEALAEKMAALIAHPETVREMAAAGRKMAEDVFDVRKVNETICRTMKL